MHETTPGLAKHGGGSTESHGANASPLASNAARDNLGRADHWTAGPAIFFLDPQHHAVATGCWRSTSRRVACDCR